MRAQNHTLPKIILITTLSLFLVSVKSTAPTQAGPAAPTFGSGLAMCETSLDPVPLVNPTTITNCSQSGIQTALDQGGHINFSCGPNPVTIAISSQLEINPNVSTVLDGGGLVTLDGQGTSRILHKDWHPGQVVNITLQNLRFINGKAPSGGGTGDHSGGAIASGHPGTRLHIINSTFSNNTTRDIHTLDNQGGAIFSSNSYETVISGSVFEGNQAGNGGAFGGIATGLFIYNTRFTNNHALDTYADGIVRGYGGAIHLDGVTNSYNDASNKRVHLCGTVFDGNTSIRGGGAIGVVVSDNKGIKSTYERSIFTNNHVFGLNGTAGQGGAIYHIEDDHAGGRGELNLEVFTTTFHGNQAGRQGGALWVYILGHGEVQNVTFEGNRTSAPFNEVGQGGAMVVTLGEIDITNVTFANNHASYQAGALHGGGSDPDRIVTLTNTIFYNNTLNYGQTYPSETEWQGYHTNRPMQDGGQNIQYPRYKPIYNNDVNNLITANPIFEDPLLGGLADNTGVNETMALGVGSPAINTGAAGCPPADQRGATRYFGCDIGAFEFLPYMTLSPPTGMIEAGGSETFQVGIETGVPVADAFTLSFTDNYPDLNVSLSPNTISGSQTATLTLSDMHSGPIASFWYTVPLTGTSSERTVTSQAQLLVGGTGIYLPFVIR